MCALSSIVKVIKNLCLIGSKCAKFATKMFGIHFKEREERWREYTRMNIHEFDNKFIFQSMAKQMANMQQMLLKAGASDAVVGVVAAATSAAAAAAAAVNVEPMETDSSKNSKKRLPSGSPPSKFWDEEASGTGSESGSENVDPKYENVIKNAR